MWQSFLILHQCRAGVLYLPNAVALYYSSSCRVDPNHKTISLLLHYCNFTTVMNHYVNIWYAEYLICNLCERFAWPPRSCKSQVENHCFGLSHHVCCLSCSVPGSWSGWYRYLTYGWAVNRHLFSAAVWPVMSLSSYYCPQWEEASLTKSDTRALLFLAFPFDPFLDFPYVCLVISVLLMPLFLSQLWEYWS